MSQRPSAAKSWFAKADKDLLLAELAAAHGRKLADLACYHAQQCAEKYLKGYLTHRDVPFKFVHALAYLVRLCMSADRSFADVLSEAAELQDYATDARYPIEGVREPTLKDARKAVARARAIRKFVRARIRE